jgi:hypothetical protein
MLQDENIKKQLYLRFFKWYKQRLRSLSAELQLGLGFKFGHSNAVGEVNGYYSLDDQYVETEDYTLTKDKDVKQIDNGFSKFFPIGYDGQAPDNYHRFGNEYLSFNEVYFCNISYRNDKNNIVTVGVIKSEKPYWNRTSDLVFKVWDSAYINKNLVGYYSVDVTQDDREFAPSTYTFLRVIDVGDKIKIENFKNYYSIAEIKSPEGKIYEYIITERSFSDKGVKTYNIVDRTDITFSNLVDNLPADGYRMWIKRQSAEEFPMFDDSGSLGATAYGDTIEGLVKNSRRIRKPSLASLFKFLFPLLSDIDPPKNFKVMVKKDSEGAWESIGTIDLSKLTFKEERNVDDILDSLRYDFTEKFSVPPVTVYDIKEDVDKGLHPYFYLSFEKIYDDEVEDGYYNGIVLRCKDRNWWFKIVNEGEPPIIGEYGFYESKVYENFYDPENIYKRLLLEKQAWETEGLIIRDLYDHSDKIARAFEQGDLNIKNSKYQGYLAKPDGGTVEGISDILRIRIPAYEKQLRFLADVNGPVYRTLYPDLIHAEDSASPEIALTYNQTLSAWNLYNAFYGKLGFYYTLNEDNNYTWKNEYIKWVLSLEKGILYQKMAKQMYEQNTEVLTLGLIEVPIIKIMLFYQASYTLTNVNVSVRSNYEGKYLQISFGVLGADIVNETLIVLFYNKTNMSGVPTTVYKSILEICSEISGYTYGGVSLFTASNIFIHYENDVTSKICYIDNQVLDPVNGIQLMCTNVADHRSSDPRILYLNKNIEDRVYTHGVRELPGFTMSYLGGYYLLKYGSSGLLINTSSYLDFKYGVFLDETGNKVITFSYVGYEGTEYVTYKLYTEAISGTVTTYTYKTLYEISYEISYDGKFNCSAYSGRSSLSCDTLIVTSGYVDSVNYQATLYATTNSLYSSISKSVNQFYYKVYKDSVNSMKLDILFYELIADGSQVVKSTTVADTFSFSFTKTDGSYKTISELCSEISLTRYKGEYIFSLKSVYEPKPNGSLLTSFVVVKDVLLPVGYDWETTVYVDTYLEAITGLENSNRAVANVENAVFSFPMYTANGNPSKSAIEGIPVSGSWEVLENEPVIEISCIDGESWVATFSDYDSGDYKSYMAPQDIIELIDQGKVLTEDQYNQIKVVEDRPSVAVLKELVLIRRSGTDESELRLNLRKYNTINALIEAITLAKFNDSGVYDSNGTRSFFLAKLIGDTNIQGLYKSYELDAAYTPIIKSFRVQSNSGVVLYKDNILVGWEISKKEFEGKFKYTMKMSQKKYSQGTSYKFIATNPARAYMDTLTANPQGFKRDILAFDIYSWDSGAQYEIRDNWIYFKSLSLDYSPAGDLGQPNKALGYGIPLSGSGHSLAPDREQLIDLINRINSNALVNKWFYADLKFTRGDKNSPGYFEYNYLPNYFASVPTSVLNDIKLKDDQVMTVSPGDGYVFTDSNITVNDNSNTIDVSCDWRYDYTFERVFFFNEPANSTLSGLEASVNSSLYPEILDSVIEATAVPAFYSIASASLAPTFVPSSLTSSDTILSIRVGLVKVPAFKLKLRAVVGATNYVINKATFQIPRTRDKLILRCQLTYVNSYALTGYDVTSVNIGNLSNFMSSIRPYTDSIFNGLFKAAALSDPYKSYESTRLLDTNSSINSGGTYLSARLNDITAFRALNMTSGGMLSINDTTITLNTNKIYSAPIPLDKNIKSMVNGIKGSYIDGFVSCGVYPMTIDSVIMGSPGMQTSILYPDNIPAHVYFGILGDIRFIQISDYNLHAQYNYLKERLGMPWRDEQGNLKYDYYTPENFNENNPCAIDLSNFLGYLRTGRYNQVKNSMVNEALPANEYLWLYMKFHKEFGCDQKVNMIKKAIQNGDFDMSTLGQMI